MLSGPTDNLSSLIVASATPCCVTAPAASERANAAAARRRSSVSSCSERRAALRAELRRPGGFGATIAALPLRADRRSALGTELSALRLGAAAGAEDGADLCQVPLAEVVHRARLLDCLLFGCRGLGGGDLLVQVRRAGLAQSHLLVPADRLAHPLAAARALLEQRADFLDGRVERRVVLRTGRHLLQRFGGLGGAAEDAAEQGSGRVGGRGSRAHPVRPEGGHVAVAALVAEELELIAALRRQVGVVARERNVRHGAAKASARGRPRQGGCRTHAPCCPKNRLPDPPDPSHHYSSIGEGREG